MPICEHCASPNVRWFTPTRYSKRAVVLLCMTCHKLTIQPPRISRELLAAVPNRGERAA